ncbi:MAG TPA: hypothetical protein PKC53_16505 [Azohydromonas sp.]|nr:hypothetical protein [Azohydromonas sp.]
MLMTTSVDQLCTVSEYGERRRHIFPTSTSLEWHLRQHKPEWVAAGALLVIAGRRVVNPVLADELVLRAGQAAAEASA